MIINNIWTGVFKKNPNVSESYFEHKKWHQKQKKKIKLLKKKIIPIKDNLTSLLLLSLNKKKIQILDYGGGYGNLFFHLKNKVKKNFKITVFDNNYKTIINSKKIFKKNSNIKFSNNLYRLKNKKFDLIYFGSVIQYVFDINSLLKFIQSVKPKYLVFYDLMAGKNKDFYSFQNFYGKKMVVKFYNLKALKFKFNKIGYITVYENEMYTELFGKLMNLPMRNFPKKYRIKYSKYLVLEKK